MADKNSKVDYELITKYLAGEASAEESYVVTLWLETSATNQQKFKRLKLLWEQTGNIIHQQPADVDVEQAWEKFQGRVNAQSEEKSGKPHFQSKSRSIYYYLSRAAAVVILAVSAYLIYESSKDPVNVQMQLATTDYTTTDTLSDGSLVSLNSYSELRFPEAFKTNERLVSLKGEAFFEVTTNPEKPFRVEVEGASIQVLGTAFLVQAYDSLETVVVGVKEGSVMVKTPNDEVVLKVGESVTIDKSTRQINPVIGFNTNKLYWKSQTLIFQNEKLQTVFETLENHYHVRIKPENMAILDCRLTAKFYGEDIDQIFEIITTNFNLIAEKDNDQFIISGLGCE